MTTENNEVKQESSQTTEPDNIPQLTVVEEKAVQEGWVPQEQWNGDPDQWRPAKEFLDRGELFKKIDDQNRTIKEVRRALLDLQEHHKNVRETEYKRALSSLKEQRKVAYSEGDLERVSEIEDRMDLVKEEQTKLKTVPNVSQEVAPHPNFVKWASENKWYETEKAMRVFADISGRELAEQGMHPDAVLIEVAKLVKKEFPHKFTNPNRERPSSVEGGGNKSNGKAQDTFQLTSEERQVMQRLVRQGALTEKQYIEDLKRVSETR